MRVTAPGGGTLYSYEGKSPTVAAGAFVATGAVVIGDVELGGNASVWFNCTVRGDVHYIRIGEATNIQDNSVLHVTHDTHPLVVGNGVTCGHGVTLHGCTVHDESLIGIGAIVLDGAVVESGAMVAAGALVPPGMVVPSGMLVAGVPAKPLRPLRDAERENLAASADRYVAYALSYAREYLSPVDEG
ncbi:MAG: gamma carbonic anhydrase family protein [Spirochaetota bacterium]